MVDGCILLLIPFLLSFLSIPSSALSFRKEITVIAFQNATLGKEMGYLKQTCVLTVDLIGGMCSNTRRCEMKFGFAWDVLTPHQVGEIRKNSIILINQCYLHWLKRSALCLLLPFSSSTDCLKFIIGCCAPISASFTSLFFVVAPIQVPHASVTVFPHT